MNYVHNASQPLTSVSESSSKTCCPRSTNSDDEQSNMKSTKENASANRFSNTATALRQAGLMEVTLESAKLMRENEQLQKDIDALQEETLQFSKILQAQLEEKIEAS